MAVTITFEDIKKKYGSLTTPVARISVNGVSIQLSKDGLELAGVDVQLTAGYEASCATYRITNCFNQNLGAFKYNALKPYILMGSVVAISLGYNGTAGEVFRGYISKVEFNYDSMDETAMPYCEVTCLDAKGIMMSNRYNKQLTSKSYGQAVQELLNMPPYLTLKSPPNFLISPSSKIVPTPDLAASAPPAGLDKTIEMYDESDYEFIVRAAKRYNYDFYVVAGEVNFSPNRLNVLPFMELGPKDDLRSLSVVYDIAGMVGTIEAKNMDPDKGIQIAAVKKINNKVSGGPFVKSIVPPQKKTVIDPSIRDVSDATSRAGYVADKTGFRFGTIDAEFIGIPDLPPACYVDFKELGDTVSNNFYITSVRHVMNNEGFTTRAIGKAASLKAVSI